MSDIICQHCKMPTYDEDALSCHACGELLRGCSSGGVMSVMRSAGMKWIWITLGLAMAIVMIVTMF